MIELRVLGASDLRRSTDGASHTLRLQPKRLALLAYLSLTTRRGGCRRDTLLALFWPECDAAHARNALNQAVYALRRALGADVLVSRGTDILDLSQDAFWCDAIAFEQALETGDKAGALEAYQGALLAGLHIGDAPDFEYWLETERERLRRQACEAAGSLADREERRGNEVGAARWLRRLLEVSPDDEVALQRLLTLLDRAGDRAGALHAYRAFERRLVQNLDLAPSPETQALMAHIRSREEKAHTLTDRADPPTKPRRHGETVGSVSVERGRASASDRHEATSLAVLPFANMSAEPEQEYFCDGMTEEIINALTKVHGLRVAARTSAFAFKDRQTDLREVGEKLNVAYVLEGSVRKAGSRVRITTQLVKVADGFHLWSERYDRKLDDVFAIQDEVALEIGNKLRGALLIPERAASAQHPTDDLKAYDCYLKGRFHWYRKNPADLRKAADYFRQAVDLDPNYAQAYTGLAMAYTSLGASFYDASPPQATFPHAGKAVVKALELNERQAEAHAILGVIRTLYQWDWKGAEEALSRAVSLDSYNALVYHAYAIFSGYMRRPAEAIDLEKQAVRLEPFVLAYKEHMGFFYYLSRQYEQAAEHLQQVLTMEPNLYLAHVWLGLAYAALDRHTEALEAFHKAIHRAGRQPYVLSMMGMVYAGKLRREARSILKELDDLSRQRYVRPTYPARIYAALGEHDRALSLLQTAYETHDDHLPVVGADPSFESLHAKPAFQTWLEKMGLDR